MQKDRDYFYRRNEEVVKRLLRGDKPTVIASDYGMTIGFVEGMFPLCNYRMFCVSVKRRFAMGETSYEIATFFKLEHKLILSVINMSFQRESLVLAIMKMHDNGFSRSKIKTVTRLSDDDIGEVLLKTGRDVERMRYYKAIGTPFTLSVDSGDWFNDICEHVAERQMPNYLMSVENKVERKYRGKAKELFREIAAEELDDENENCEEDYLFVQKVISKLRKLKGVTKRDVITKAVLYYAKSIGVLKSGGGLGGKEVTLMNNRLQCEIDEFYLSMAEIKNTKHHQMQERFTERYNSNK